MDKFVQEQETTYGISCQQFYNYQIKHLSEQEGDESNYSWILILRLCILLASSAALLANIVVIFRSN